MKTSSESQKSRSTSSPPRLQSRPRPKSRPRYESRLTVKTHKNQTKTRNQSGPTMNESPPSDTIHLDSSNEEGPADPLLSSGPGPDVVDLTSVSSDPAVVVDLTNDTVLVLDEEHTHSYVLSSDEEEPTATGTRTTATASGAQSRETRFSGVHISCPLCMDSYSEIVDSGRLLVSTRCGHVFCSVCLRDALNHSRCCPMCRKKLQKGHYHPIHI